MDDSSTDDDAASQTTEDDPQIPEKQDPPPPPPVQPPPPPAPTARQRPHYQPRHVLRGHTMSISSVKFSPDGTLLASCAADNVVKIWSPHTGELIRNLHGHTKGCSDVAWSSDSVYLASASDDTTIRIWDVDSGITTKTLKGHTSFVFCVNYNTASTHLVSGGWKCIKTLNAHLDYVTAVHYNRDGSLIVSCALDGLIRIWNTTSGQCLKTLAEGHNAICQHVQFSPNSKYILSTAHDSAIRLWDYHTSRCLKTYMGHQNMKYCIAACFSVTGGKWIVSGSEDHKVYLWDLQTREVVQVLEGHEEDVVVAVAVSVMMSVVELSLNPELDTSTTEHDCNWFDRKRHFNQDMDRPWAAILTLVFSCLASIAATHGFVKVSAASGSGPAETCRQQVQEMARELRVVLFDCGAPASCHLHIVNDTTRRRHREFDSGTSARSQRRFNVLAWFHFSRDCTMNPRSGDTGAYPSQWPTYAVEPHRPYSQNHDGQQDGARVRGPTAYQPSPVIGSGYAARNRSPVQSYAHTSPTIATGAYASQQAAANTMHSTAYNYAAPSVSQPYAYMPPHYNGPSEPHGYESTGGGSMQLHTGLRLSRASSSSGVDVAHARVAVQTRSMASGRSQSQRSANTAANYYISYQPSSSCTGMKHHLSPEQAISSSSVPSALPDLSSSTTTSLSKDRRFSKPGSDLKPKFNAAAEYQADLREKKNSKLRWLNHLLPRHLQTHYDPPRLLPAHILTSSSTQAIEHIEQLHEENEHFAEGKQELRNDVLEITSNETPCETATAGRHFPADSAFDTGHHGTSQTGAKRSNTARPRLGPDAISVIAPGMTKGSDDAVRYHGTLIHEQHHLNVDSISAEEMLVHKAMAWRCWMPPTRLVTGRLTNRRHWTDSMESQKTVLITGCSAGGIGHALALEFKLKGQPCYWTLRSGSSFATELSPGYRVFATSRNLKSMADLPEKGIEILALDVTKQENVKEARDKVAELTGGKLNVLVNNAGALYAVPATDIDIEEAKKLFDVNLFGAMEMVKQFIHLLIASQDGRILNIGSVAGTLPLPFGATYNASKAAMHAYSDTLRVELAPFGIQVTTVVPGGVKSNIARTERQLAPDSLYQPISDEYQKRLTTSQTSTSVTAEECAREITKEALKSRQKLWLWTAALSTTSWFLTTFMPRGLPGYILSRRFGLNQLAEKVKEQKKAN
ncbi:hypothetical protein EVG20_g3620 [Dentipellis fragilis]|uniref:WDR5-like beta-propeller domain-containing protein n=1 Tax=Dentipellis fragilis TaxID=205917 RepID=A0A4Y9Z4M1_9AGAM|nr:hypothetical protein EVG20_g3620 [Dentipellis fragilis]